MTPQHEWHSVAIGDLREGEVFTTGRRCRSRRVGQLERWTRWDDTPMVTVIDTDGVGLAAREETFQVLALRWTDDAGRTLAAVGGGQT